jgi:hypothetical protein
MAEDVRRNNLAVAVIALAATITSLRNGFAYDDIPIIATNDRVHDLASWWSFFGTSYWPPQYGESLYRPTSMLTYATQWAIGDGNPMVFHAISITLFILLAILVLTLLRELMEESAALVGGLLFAAHPVHTEAVANVVGQAELLAGIGVVAAMTIYLRARRSGGPTITQSGVIALLYAGASLAKEHALFLPLLIGAAELILTREAVDRAKVGKLLSLLLIVGAAVLGARTAVLGSLFGEQSPVAMDASTRIWMMLRVIPEWVRLLAWPSHLSAEYGPNQIQVIDGPSAGGLLGIVILVTFAAAFVVCVRRQPAIAFALAWLAITFVPVSNLVSGVVLQERTLMLPSVSAVMIIGAAFQSLMLLATTPRARYALVSLAGVLMIAGTVRSALRNPTWHDNLTLFTQMVKDAPLSYRAHYLYGSELFGIGRAAEGEQELRRAIALSRNDSDPFNFLATKYREARAYSLAIPLYREALAIRPSRPDSRFGLALSLLETGDISGAMVHADTGLANGQLKSYFMWVRTRADSVKLAGGARTPD